MLGGKYRVEGLIQQGGMGVVLLAHHEELDQRIAIKVLDDQFATNDEVVGRFVQEARAAAKLESKHVVRVTDVGTFEGVGPYIVMEHLAGIDLRDLIDRHGPLPAALAVDFVLEAIDALAEAHSLGIVHRDIKPSNLFLAERADGSKIIKVLDFGVSKMHAKSGPVRHVTQARMILGSPSYVSPEQIRSPRDVDARTDIWSLGVVLYELLTGTKPFHGDTLEELAHSILDGRPRPLSEGADVPPALESAVMRCARVGLRPLAAPLSLRGEREALEGAEPPLNGLAFRGH